MKSTEHHPRGGPLGRYVAVALTVGIGILATAIVFAQLRSQEQHSLRGEFSNRAWERAEAWRAAIENRLAAFDSMYSLYLSSEYVTRDEFHVFTAQAIMPYKGVRAVRWVPRIWPQARYEHEQQARRDGIEGYRIAESARIAIHDSEPVAFFPVYYSESSAQDSHILGFDLACYPSWQGALDHAVETGRMIVTTGVRALPGEEGLNTFVAIRPVYHCGKLTLTAAERRENLQGYIIGVFDIGLSVEFSLASVMPGGINVELLKETVRGPQRLYYHLSRRRFVDCSGAEEGARSRAWTWEKTLDFGEEQWVIRCVPAKAFFSGHYPTASFGSLIVGLAATCAAAFYVHSYQTRYRIVERLVEERTHELSASRAELKQRNEFLQHILASLVHPLYVIDARDFTVKLSNQSCDDSNPRAECLTCHELIYGNDRPCERLAHACPVVEVRESRKPITFERQGTEREGPDRTFEVHAYPVLDAKGDITEVIEHHVDITGRKRAERMLRESEEKFRVLFEVSSDAIMTLEPPTWRFTSGNPATVRMFKARDEAEFVSKGPADYSPEFQSDGARSDDRAEAMIEKAMREGSHFFEWDHLRADGECFPATVLLTRVRLGEKVFLQATVRDITENKRVEREQAELLKKLEFANRELKDFAYIVSHDLKAPLRAIHTLAEWMITDLEERLGEEGRKRMHLLLGRVERMQSLIGGILEYCRIGRIREEHASIDLNELVGQVIEDLSPPASISFEVHGELPAVCGEPTRIRQVFQNLVSNAVKYMDKERGRVWIGCEEEPDTWRFFVGDNGPGIEEKHFERIFQIFQTLAPRDEIESTGIGLTVVKKIVEHHHGRIWLESKVGEGSVFYFTLPKEPVETRNEQPEPVATAG